MPKIITVTLNTAIDNLIEIDTFIQGSAVRAKKSTHFAAGKAINASRTLACLGYKTTAFCFVGVSDAHFFINLKSEYLAVIPFNLEGATRKNITVVNAKNELILHVQTQGFEVTKELMQSFESGLAAYISKGDFVIMSGSLPQGLHANSYKTLISKCQKAGAKVIFDSSGAYLKHGVEAIPYAIKPNEEELADMLGKTQLTKAEIILAAQNLNEKGIEYVLVSRGERGAILTKRGESSYWEGHVKLPSSKIRGNVTGCGDAMTGALALSFIEALSPEKILALAISCGSAHLLSKEPGVCKPAHLAYVSNYVEIIEYEE